MGSDVDWADEDFDDDDDESDAVHMFDATYGVAYDDDDIDVHDSIAVASTLPPRRWASVTPCIDTDSDVFGSDSESTDPDESAD